MSAAGKKWEGPLVQVDENKWKIPKEYHPRMKVEGLVYSSQALLPAMLNDQALEQVANVAQLPGILRASFAMPDIHWGYGFPIGGVAAFDMDEGVISPGGVGYDINCGVRLITSRLEKPEVAERMPQLLAVLYRNIPAGVGCEGRIHLKNQELRRVLQQGSRWAIQAGYGWPEDSERTEDQGQMKSADDAKVSGRALERGASQLGTLGSGNHFLEIQEVAEIYDPEIAAVYGLSPGMITVMVHCGSRGLGYQVCDDFLEVFRQASRHYGIHLPDEQLACAPVSSPEGHAYFSAMSAAANYAWANRQCITHWVRETFEEVFQSSAERLGMHVLYDVAHNIAKKEQHTLGVGQSRTVCVLRKGATRAFPANHPEVTACYRKVGQPVLIPGSMGTASYVCAGTEQAMQESFGSTAHGAGRVLSRNAAVRKLHGRSLTKELSQQGIAVMARSQGTLAEEAPEAYKDIEAVIATIQQAGLAKKVARLLPLGVVKG